MDAFEQRVHDVAKGNRLNDQLFYHSWERHILKVVAYGKMLCEEEPEEVRNNVLIVTYFHDVGRISDGKDSDHALRGGQISRRIIPVHFPDADLDSIIFAIDNHSNTQVYPDMFPVVSNYDIPDGVDSRIVMYLWDADRLDLPRLERRPLVNLSFLSSEKAKRYANTPEHKKLYPGWK
jgi:hypothetical protein